MKRDEPTANVKAIPGAIRIAGVLLGTSHIRPLSTLARIALSALAGFATISALAFFMGFMKGTSVPAASDRAIVIQRGASGETDSQMSAEVSREIGYLDNLARSTMWTLSSPERVVTTALETPSGEKPRAITLRKVGPVASLIRDGFDIVAGRRFKPGTREAIVGQSLLPALPGNGVLGSSLILNGEPWEIVGVFSTTDRLAENEIWIGANAPGGAGSQADKTSSTRVRLTTEESFETFADAVTDLDPAFQAQRHSDFVGRQIEQLFWETRFVPAQIGAILFTLAAFLGFGLTHAARSPGREEMLGDFRGQGVGGRKLLASQWLESMAFAILGAALGSIVAWLGLDGFSVFLTRPDSGALIVIQPSLTAPVFAAGFFHALALGCVGGIGATLRAHRESVVSAPSRKNGVASS